MHDRKLQCSLCKRRVHFKCTLLPDYQLKRFQTFGTNYAKYICMTCMEVPCDLNEANQEKNRRDEERSNSSETRVILLNKKLQEKDAELEMLRKKIEALQNRISTSTGQSKRRRINEEEIDNAEVVLKDNEIKRITTENKNLRERLNERETTLQETFQKLAEADSINANDKNGTFLEKMESFMQKRFDEMQSNLTTMIDQKIDKSISGTVTNTYASAISGDNREVKDAISTQLEQANRSTTDNFRSIMLSARNEELAEERDKKLRACNIIIHGSDENNAEKPTDEVFVNNMFFRIGVEDCSPKSIVRLGNTELNRKRPIKVTFKNEQDKEKVMSNLRNLKDKKIYNGISITDDYTVTERKMIKEYTIKAKEKNSIEGENSEFEWKVRGTPKNGLVVKRFKKVKKNSTNNQ